MCLGTCRDRTFESLSAVTCFSVPTQHSLTAELHGRRGGREPLTLTNLPASDLLSVYDLLSVRLEEFYWGNVASSAWLFPRAKGTVSTQHR